jgi:hypothetical protein
MFRRIRWLVTLLIALTAPAYASSSRLGYDPHADPFAQYQVAIEQARASNRLLLIIAGGDWCLWCHRLQRFLEQNADVHAQLAETFVIMKVYVGAENSNSFFFEQLPRAYGAPHFWVIAPDRTVLTSQSTAPFESGKRGYDKERFLSWVRQWSDARMAERVASRED